MRLGVDFGTTRTVVAAADRGNYPIVTFQDAHGDHVDHFPSVVAEVDGELRFGFDALAAAHSGASVRRSLSAPLRRSLKRWLGASDLSETSTITVGDTEYPLIDVVTGFLTALRRALRTSSIGDDLAEDQPPQAVIAVPAHAHGAQRFWTLEAFQRAGFDVLAMVNEPSAAAFEYTHRQPRTVNSRRTRMIVYDLGGGTFDASSVSVGGAEHEILASIGLNRLGGDDFDALLAELCAATAGISLDALPTEDRERLLDDAREAKERIAPQSKKIVVEVCGDPVTVEVNDFYDRASELVEFTLAAMEPLLEDLIADPSTSDIAGIHLVGGASSLPVVPRILREHFGRRVHRSPNPMASTAIGLAIAADPSSGYALTDRLSRGFGVFREGEGGTALVLDEIFGPSVEFGTGTRTVTREYRAAHNIGWFRFVEYPSRTITGGGSEGVDVSAPAGDLLPYGRIIMPFDAALEQLGDEDLCAVPVERVWPAGPTGPAVGAPLIREKFTLDSNGIITVEITNLDSGHTRSRRLTGAG